MAHAFLFTDIEGSTRLWEEHPDTMPAALARHDSILTGAVETAGGRVLKTTGDGLIAVFDTVLEAVVASSGAQMTLAGEEWDIGAPLKVRMGLHAGDADERDGDFFGPTMNRAARVMAAAHGGQIVLSDAAAAASRGQLAADTRLMDLGTYRLKDLAAPEHLYQLISGDLTADFPPLNTLDSTPNNLPFQNTEFFGREKELGEISTMLEDTSIRLLTLLGPGGTGKTRLATQTAAEQLESFADGAYFVDLASERESEPAFEAIARALDVPVGPDGDSLSALKTHLRDRRMLVILDNFEQVTSAAPGIAEMVDACPGLKVVVTSREALRVRPEHLYRVPPMSLPDPDSDIGQIAEAESVRLFTQRARAIRSDFVLSVENAPVVVAICARLDGLPLAIELAAARLNIFSPADLLKRLEDRMDVLAADSRDRPERQQTLWGAIDWSFELLDESDCRFFEMMSVFSTASIEALESVARNADPDLDPLTSIASLVDKSLVRSQDVEGTRRFSMLRTVREYAIDRLAGDPDWELQARRSHAKYYSEYTRLLTDLLSGAERDDTLGRISVELDNLRSAWKFWVDQGELEQLFGLIDGLWALNEARGWYHAALQLARDMLDVLATTAEATDYTEEELALRVSLARGIMAIKGYDPEVEQEFQRAAELAEGSGSAANQVPVLRALSLYYVMTVQFERALEVAQKIMAIAEAEGNRPMAIEGHLLYGSALLDRTEEALEHLDKAIALYDPSNVGASRFRMGTSPGVSARVAAGITRWRAGELTRGVAHLSDAVVLARELDHPFSLSYALFHSAYLHTQRGEFNESLVCALELQQVAAENDYQIWAALGKVVEGVSRAGSGDIEGGLALTESGIEIYSGLTTPPVFWPLVLSLQAFAHSCAGNLESAQALIDESIAMMGEEGGFPEFLLQRGDIVAARTVPDADRAEADYRKGREIAQALGLLQVELQALNRLVTLLNGRDNQAEAIDDLHAVYGQIEGGVDELEMIRARSLLSDRVDS